MLHSNQAKYNSKVSLSRTIKVLLADDQKVVQQKLQQMLSPQANLELVGIASDGQKAIALVESLKPDVILIDIEMPKMNGIEATKIINQRFPQCKILVISSHENQEYVQQIVAAGADGYILKSIPTEDLVTAIDSVCKGYSYFGSQLLKKVQLAEDGKSAKSLANKSKILPKTKGKYASGVKWLTRSGLLAAIAIGSWFGYDYYLRQSVDPIPVQLFPVQRETVENTVSESGKMELGGQQTLKSPGENATVEQVLVTEGQEVTAGETLLLLRDREAQEEEQDQKVENSKNALTTARNQGKVREAQAKVAKKQAKVREAKELFRNGYIPETELEEDQEELDTAEAELNDAQLELNSAKLDLENGQAKLINIQQKLRDRLVTSTVDGIVLDVSVKNGDGITTDTKLVTIGDPEQEVVKLQLTTLNAAKVKLNQVARVSAIGPNPQTYTGKVIQLSPQASAESEDSSSEMSASTDASTSGQAKVDAIVLLDKPSKTLIPGSQVNVEIISQQRQNVITLPIEMVEKNGNQSFVWVKDDQGKAQKQPITRGLEDLTSVEVTSGLQAGEQVILPPPDGTLTPGIPLQTNPSQ